LFGANYAPPVTHELLATVALPSFRGPLDSFADSLARGDMVLGHPGNDRHHTDGLCPLTYKLST